VFEGREVDEDEPVVIDTNADSVGTTSPLVKTDKQKLAAATTLRDAMAVTQDLQELLLWMVDLPGTPEDFKLLAQDFAPFLARIPVIEVSNTAPKIKKIYAAVSGKHVKEEWLNRLSRSIATMRRSNTAQGLFTYLNIFTHQPTHGTKVPVTGSVIINLKAIAAGERASKSPLTIEEMRTFLHEAMHAATAFAIDNVAALNDKQKSAITRLNDLHRKVRNQVRKDFKDGKLPDLMRRRYQANMSYYYGNLHEFVAFGLTDAEFGGYLRQMILPKDTQNVWSHMVQALKDLFNVAPDQSNAFLELAQITRDMAMDIYPQISTAYDVTVAPVPAKASPLVQEIVASQNMEHLNRTVDFDSWFGGSKVVDETGAPLRVYHGTASSFDAFRPGSWFAAKPELALRYIGGGRREAAKVRKGSNVMGVYVAISYPIDFSGRLSESTSVRKLLTEQGLSDAQILDALDLMEATARKVSSDPDAPRRAYGTTSFSSDTQPKEYALDRTARVYEHLDSPMFRAVLQSLGFDGVQAQETEAGVTSTTWQAFEPTQIKSAIGNQGTYSGETENILLSVADPEVTSAWGFEKRGNEWYLDGEVEDDLNYIADNINEQLDYISAEIKDKADGYEALAAEAYPQLKYAKDNGIAVDEVAFKRVAKAANRSVPVKKEPENLTTRLANAFKDETPEQKQLRFYDMEIPYQEDNLNWLKTDATRADGTKLTELERRRAIKKTEADIAQMKEYERKLKAGASMAEVFPPKPDITENILLSVADPDVAKTIDKNPESGQALYNKVSAMTGASLSRNNLTLAAAWGAVKKSKIRDWAPGATLRAIPRQYLPDFVPEAPSVRKWVDEAKRMTATVSAYMNNYSPLVAEVELFNRKHHATMRALAQLESLATMAGVDPTQPYSSSRGQKYRSEYPGIKAKWDELGKMPGGEQAQKLFGSMRDAHKQTFNDTSKALMARIEALENSYEEAAAAAKAAGKMPPARKGMDVAKLRQLLESQKLPDPYFPLYRFGDYWVSATKGEGKDADRIFARFETMEEATQFAEEIDKAGYVHKSGMVADGFSDPLRQLDPNLFTQIEEILGQISDPDERRVLQDQIHQRMLMALPETSMRKHMIHRKNRQGYSLDVVRGFAKSMFHSAQQIGKLEHLTQLQDDLKAAIDELRAAGGPTSRTNRYLGPMERVLNEHMQWTMNPQTSAWANNLNRLGFTWFLGATPAAAVLNMTQTVMMGAPVIAARKGVGMRRAAAALLSASNDHRKMAAMNMKQRVKTKSIFLQDKYSYEQYLTDQLKKAKNLSDRKRIEDEIEAYKQMHAEGTLDRTMAHDVMGISDAGERYTGSGYAVSEKIGAMFHAAEVWNREVTAMAAFRLAKEDGMSYLDALQVAKESVDVAHFDYTSANRPVIVQNDMGKVLFLFRQHSLNMTYRLLRDGIDTLKSFKKSGATNEQYREARRRFSAVIAMASIFTGVSGLPMYGVVKMLAAALLGDEDEKYDMDAELRAGLAQAYGEKVATAIMKGPVSAFSGADIASRTSLASLWFREPLTDEDLEGKFWHYAQELGGANLAMIAAPFRGASQIMQGYDRGWEQMMPKAARDIVRAVRYTDEGLTNFRGDAIIPKDAFGTGDIFWQAFGFSPELVSTRYEQNRAIKNQEQFILTRRSGLMTRYWMALQEADQAEIAEVRERIRAYNEANPEYPLTGKQIRDSIAQRKRISKDSLAGINVNKNLRYLAERLQFIED
jgi:hypothetical protein